MKILMLNSEYPPLGGGQGNANKYVYEEFKKYKDLKVDIITASINKYKEEKTKIGKIYFLDIGKKNKNLHFQTSKELLSYSIKSFRLAKKLCKKEKYDLIVAWAGVPAGFLAYSLKKKYIVLLRGADVPFWDERWKTLDKLIFSWLSPIIWKKAERVYANSSGLKELALKSSKKQKINVILNGVDTNFFKPGKKLNRNIILGVGRLIKRKGFDTLIKSLDGINGCELWLVGDGPEKENLKFFAKKNKVKLRLFGLKDKKELLKIYQQSSIFCLPSLNEGMSNTILEAMACGLPIIATNVAGNKELIKDNGFIVNINNQKEIKEKILTLIKNKEIRRGMGLKSRQLAEKMSWTEITKQYYNDFKEITK